ncbi:MAG: hypothetical protein PVI86_00720 [Phycisphaerae bacterium]|jgi:hypothetical protein
MTKPRKSTRPLATATLVALLTSGCAGPVNQEANKIFMNSLGNTSVTVFPAFVRQSQTGEYDADAADKIGAFLTDEGVAQASIADAQVPIPGSWRHNQAAMLKESADAFAAYLADHPVETDYALLPEYLLGPSAVGGIHCYVVDARNRLAFAILLNSHWDLFIEMDPKTVDDCTDVLIEALRRDLLTEGSGG